MKYMIASDIHGSVSCCRRMAEAYYRERAGRLLLLGDLLYHGPRNPLPEGYDPKETAALLNEMGGELLCVRGNCDAEVDQMMLRFPVMAEYALVAEGGRVFFLHHGHIYHEKNLPPLTASDIFVCGHTHVPRAEKRGGRVYLNPGSVALPKAGNPPTYGILENDAFVIKTMDGAEVSRLCL